MWESRGQAGQGQTGLKEPRVPSWVLEARQGLATQGGKGVRKRKAETRHPYPIFYREQ